MPTLNIGGHRVTVGDEFLKLSPEDQDATVDEIAKTLGPGSGQTGGTPDAFGQVQQQLNAALPPHMQQFAQQPRMQSSGPPTGMLANAGAGASDFLADAMGAPVDAATWAVNQGARRLTGNEQPLINNPPGGSESLKSAMGLVGADPRNVQANTTGEKIAREAGAAIPATVAPYLGARAAIERGATGMLPRMLGGPAGPGQSAAETTAGAIGNAATGVGGAIGGNVAKSMTDEDSPYRGVANVAGQLAGGALTSGLLGKAANVASRVIQPQVDPQVQLLQREGVTPTIGQILGAKTSTTEEKLTSLPLLGDSIRAARQRATDQLNRAATNRPLREVGESLDPTTATGRDSITEMWDKIGDAYRAAVPQSGMFLPQDTINRMNNLIAGVQNLSPQHATEFNRRIQTELLDRISPANHISGESLKAADSALGQRARDFRTPNATAWDRDLSDAFREAQAIMRDGLASVSPDVSSQVRAADRAHAMALRVGNASKRADQNNGIFTPAQLQAAVKKYGEDRPYQKGDALMQDLADASRAVLGNRVPDSGSPGRLMLPYAIGASLTNPMAAAKLGLGMAAAGGLYSPLGQRATAAMLTKRPQGAQRLAEITRALSPPVGAAGSYPLWGALAPP